MPWISKRKYLKYASRINARILKIDHWIYRSKENKGKEGGWMISALSGVILELKKNEAKKMLPPNTNI